MIRARLLVAFSALVVLTGCDVTLTAFLVPPNNPSLQLFTVFAQGAVLAPGANGLGALFANALAARVP